MAATPVDEDLAKVNLADAPPPPPGAGGFSFAAAPVGGAPAGGFSFNLAPPAAPGAGGGDDEDEEEDEDEMAGPPLPKEVLQRVLGLKALEEQREAQMKAYLVERAALEQKYKALIDPIYGERSKIVRGELEPALSDEDRATVEQAAVERFVESGSRHNDAEDDEDEDEERLDGTDFAEALMHWRFPDAPLPRGRGQEPGRG